ncbi:hypothetical protein [Laspinema olomoucense]|uniref:Uncharacterized protein n=1 Tax=Laspinema olomoucense D3b TaxID=2953688 RepID=A0ABT2NHW2_9CYAN|nr:hypothetical protein [Laspinema sp. D3b]MCT7980871.1 hypothetical protein [Laspinema sp. D3b]
MNEYQRRKFKGTPEDYKRFVDAMNSEGLDVVLESMIPAELEGNQFEFTAIQLIAILRLSEALARLLQCSTEEVHSSFLSAASAEALSLSPHEKMAIVNYFYSKR